MAHLDQTMLLPDGRRLGFDDIGPRDGRVAFYFHGVPTCRLEWRLFADEARLERIGVRLIAPDRPGVGLSDFQAGRGYRDWPADVVALADGLGIEHFAVLGYSGGGPYAAACALHIPARLTAAGIVSGVAPADAPGLEDGANPINRGFLTAARDRPRQFRITLGAIVWLLRHAPWLPLSGQFSRGMPAPDREEMDRPEVRQAYVAALIETLRGGARGAQWDTALAFSPWDFDPRAVTAPLLLWHGEEDCNDPPAMGRYLAGAFPRCRAEFVPGEGHVSLLLRRAEEILARLVA